MTFSNPLWLLAGLVACIGLAWMWRRYDARQKAALARFISPHLRAQLTKSVSVVRRRAKRGLVLGALALLCVAMAGPQGGYRWEQVTRRGNDIIFAIDTSRSMLTPDVKPNRLVRAKLAIDDFVTQLDGDSVGLVAFAGNAFLQSPLTLDYNAFHEALGAVDTNIIPRGGTDIASAIREAQTALGHRPGSDKILILVTDGEDLEGDALVAAKAASQKDGMKIYTVGVGTSNGDLIPLPPDQGGGFLKDADGNPVKSHLDEAALKAIAAATGGLYAPLGVEGQGLETIYQQALAPLAKHDLASRQQRVYVQLYQWPLAVAFAMLMASMLIGTRRWNLATKSAKANEKKPREQIVPGLVVPGAVALLGLLSLVPLQPARASTASAATAYAKGNFVAAEQDYAAAAKRNPKNPVLQYNVGTAAYRAGQFAAASKAFQASLSGAQSADAKRLAEQQDTYYNLGNTLYRTGEKTEQANPEETIQNWTQSVKEYDAALQLRAGDADSKFNRDFVMRKLAELQKKQAQQQPQKKNQSGANSKQDKQDKGKQQDKSGQGKQQDKQGQGSQQGKQGQGGQQGDQQAKQDASKGQGKNQPQPQSGQPAQNNSQGKDAQAGNGTPGKNQPPQPASPGQQPASGAAQPQAASQASGAIDQRGDETARAADARREPGQMSRDEARELLDSLKGEERRLPVAPIARSGANAPASDQPVKDW